LKPEYRGKQCHTSQVGFGEYHTTQFVGNVFCALRNVASFSIATLDVAPKFPMVIFSADAQIKF
jgi:hypothetical protein